MNQYAIENHRKNMNHCMTENQLYGVNQEAFENQFINMNHMIAENQFSLCESRWN